MASSYTISGLWWKETFEVPTFSISIIAIKRQTPDMLTRTFGKSLAILLKMALLRLLSSGLSPMCKSLKWLRVRLAVFITYTLLMDKFN